MVPGVEVAQINANQWAISIRGFNAVYSNKVLVLIDGRSVYGDQFSGVYWDQIDVPLENIERIEVIRGPGGTVWGANAVNGVINIITATAADTKGGLVVAGPARQEAAGLPSVRGRCGFERRVPGVRQILRRLIRHSRGAEPPRTGHTTCMADFEST